MFDSTGHVYMIDPVQQEMEIDYYNRIDAASAMFSPAEYSGYQKEFEAYLDGAEFIETTPITFVCALCHENECTVAEKFCSACAGGEFDDIPF